MHFTACRSIADLTEVARILLRRSDAACISRLDIKYQVADSFTWVVEWDNVKRNIPTNLKILPFAVVPQQNRRDRIILDPSFPVSLGGTIDCVSGHQRDNNAHVSPVCTGFSGVDNSGNLAAFGAHARGVFCLFASGNLPIFCPKHLASKPN